MGELNIYGVYVPILLIQAVLAHVLLRIVMFGGDRLVEQRWIAQPNIFYLCVFVVLLWLVHYAFILCQI